MELVGDRPGRVMRGRDTTPAIIVDDIARHTAAPRRIAYNVSARIAPVSWANSSFEVTKGGVR